MFHTKFEPYNFNIGFVRIPSVEVSDSKKQELGLTTEASNYEYLQKLIEKGFQNRISQNKIPSDKIEVYKKRVDIELDVFNKNGLTDYFLLLYDILNWCDENNIARGVARGSASGSICLFLLSITNIDPILHDLYFTRFINEARLQSKLINNVLHVQGTTAPDCDSDVSYRNRQKVIDYIETKYQGKTAKISTNTRLSGKLLIKEVTKAVLNYNELQAKELSDMVERHFGSVEKLEQTYKHSIEFKKWADLNRECFEIAKSLELLIKNKSKHPSGIAVSYYNVNDYIPLELSSTKEVVTSYDMYDIANFLLKIDILGLKNADINYDVCKLIGLNQNQIDINDKSIYDYLKVTSSYYGLFQIESGLTKQVVLKIRPNNIDELAACIAISRPGAYNYIDKYYDYLRNNKLETIYPPIDDILKVTGNIILYQEQINQICQEIYKLSAVDADLIRFCIGKKDKEAIKKWEPVLFEQGQKLNIPKEVTQYFWDTCNKSADYLFVRGHGYSYAYMTAINTYLKANYQKQFYLCLLEMSKYEPNALDVIAQIKTELNSFKIKLLPPDLLKSELSFKIEGNDIRYGLGNIRGVAEKSFEKLLKFRKNYINKFEAFLTAKQSGLNVGITTSLIMSGCLDSLITKSRSYLVMECQLFNILTPKEKNLVLQFADKFNFDLINIIKHISSNNLIKDTRMETIRSRFKNYNKIYEQNKLYPKFANYWYEKYHLGFSYSYNLIDVFRDSCSSLVTLEDISNFDQNETCAFVAEVVKCSSGKSKNNKRMIKLEVKDDTLASKRIYLCGDEKIAKFKEMNTNLPKETQIVFVRGKRFEDIVFADFLSTQDQKIFVKLSDIE